jgi:hypothetical protein
MARFDRKRARKLVIISEMENSPESGSLPGQVGETGFAGAEGATAPETLRQKDRLPRNTLESRIFGPGRTSSPTV